ncbi:MAG: glycosyltransferase [Spirochaetes bacterium]|nr:glycosyltransferase [Spirochaetota bacterium]
MKDFVSVIIPVFNRGDELKRALKSVLNQTYQDFEIIIIDDCSQIEINNAVKNFKDKRIRLFRNDENKGVSYSRNIGIKQSNYDIICFLDSDDEWIRDKIRLQVEFLKKNKNLNVVHTEEIWIRNSKRVNQGKRHIKSGGDIFERSLELCLMSPSSIMLKKNIFDRYGCFNETLPVCEDYDLWLRISAFEHVGFIEKPLIYKYGGNSDQLSKKYEAMDKFRVMSLINIYKNLTLPKDKREALIKTALKKIAILLNGAVKRDKILDKKLYESWLKLFNN